MPPIAKRREMRWYGTGMMMQGRSSTPILRVYAAADLFQMRQAQCEWLNEAPLKGIVYESINKAAEALRWENLRLEHGSPRPTCNIWKHFTIDPEHTISVDSIRRSVGFEQYLS